MCQALLDIKVCAIQESPPHPGLAEPSAAESKNGALSQTSVLTGTVSPIFGQAITGFDYFV